MTRSSPSAAGASGDVPVRDAATVMLLRDGAAELEVWLLTRVGGMAFAGDASPDLEDGIEKGRVRFVSRKHMPQIIEAAIREPGAERLVEP